MNSWKRMEWLLAGALVVGGCSAVDRDVGTSAAHLESDAAADADAGAGSDAEVDLADASPDALLDASTDALLDASTDALLDASTDALLDASTDANDAAPAQGPVVVVTISGFTFPPVTVARGTTVRWVNASRAPHTVTSGASSDPADHPGASFDKVLPKGQTFEHTFANAGQQPYFCRFHEAAGMTGTVTVLP